MWKGTSTDMRHQVQTHFIYSCINQVYTPNRKIRKTNTSYEYVFMNHSNKLCYEVEYTEQAFICILVAYLNKCFNFPDHTN